MNKPAVVLSILVIVAAMLAAIFFWPAILEGFINPLALAVWVLLRIFVLSIDQKYYWGALIAAGLLIFYRLLPRETASGPAGMGPNTNETIESLERWRSLLTPIDNKVPDEKTFKQELIRLVASSYAAKQHSAPNFLFYDALKQGDIRMPAHLHDYLFPRPPDRTGWSLKRLALLPVETARKWLRRWRGQDVADHYRLVAETLSFVENSVEDSVEDSLETDNDSRKYSPDEN